MRGFVRFQNRQFFPSLKVNGVLALLSPCVAAIGRSSACGSLQPESPDASLAWPLQHVPQCVRLSFVSVCGRSDKLWLKLVSL